MRNPDLPRAVICLVVAGLLITTWDHGLILFGSFLLLCSGLSFALWLTRQWMELADEWQRLYEKEKENSARWRELAETASDQREEWSDLAMRAWATPRSHPMISTTMNRATPREDPE